MVTLGNEKEKPSKKRLPFPCGRGGMGGLKMEKAGRWP